jgi:O-antigen ligase
MIRVLCKTVLTRWTAVVTALLATALALSQTRGAVFGLFAGLAALFLLDRRLRRWVLGAAAVFAAVLVLWEATAVRERTLRSLVAEHAAWSESGQVKPSTVRYVLWSVAVRAFKDHPWTGVGPGQYRTVFPFYHPAPVAEDDPTGSAHDLYLHQAAERGLLGLAALAAVLGIMTALAFLGALRNPNPWTLLAAAAMAAFLVMNLTEVAFQNEQVSALLLFIWSWGRANASRRTEQ